MTEKIYKQLPGIRRSIMGTQTLWMGKDHLLFLYYSGYTEQYKRFYYSDIQAIIIHKTLWGKIFYPIFLFLLGIIFLAGILIAKDDVLMYSGALNGFFFCLFLIDYILKGSICSCYLKTAVQTEKLASLNRLKVARKALKLIKPLIEESQKLTTPETMEKTIINEQISE